MFNRNLASSKNKSIDMAMINTRGTRNAACRPGGRERTGVSEASNGVQVFPDIFEG